MDLASYADAPTPNTDNLGNEKVIKLLKKF